VQIYNAQCHRDQGRFIVLLSTHELEFFSVHPNFLRPLPASRRSSFVICDNSCTISVVSCQVNERLPSLHRRFTFKTSINRRVLIFQSKEHFFKQFWSLQVIAQPFKVDRSISSSCFFAFTNALADFSAKISSKFSTFPFVNNVPRLFIAVPHLKFFP
jgi:hypothetical protein